MKLVTCAEGIPLGKLVTEYKLPFITKQDWSHASYTDSLENAFKKMKQSRYDVLPVKEADGSYKKYFTTKEWGNFTIDNLEERKIKKDDCLDHAASIEEIIKVFAERDRNYFFLINEKEIIGLINIGNLNCKYTYLFIYNLIAMLELALGKFINESGIDDDELIRILLEHDKSVKPLIRYRREVKKGLDHKFIECAYLGDMAWFIGEKKLYRKFKMKAKEFESSIKLINKLRNIAAHPVNSLVKGRNSVVELNLAVGKIRGLIEALNG